MTDEAKALVERVETLPDTHALPSTLALLFDLRGCIETQAREIERLQEACERVKCAAVATAKIRLAKRERELEVCGSNMSRAKMKCRADEAAILLGELRALDVAAIIGDGHDQ